MNKFISKIFNNLPLNIAKDKFLHFLVGTILSLLLIPIFNLPGLIVVAIVAGGKEIYDLVSGKGTPEFMDFVWTIIPGLIIFFLCN